MIKVKDGYAKLISTTYVGSSERVLLSNGGDFGLHTGRNNEANKLVRTDASGYIYAGWINTTSGDMGTTAITKIYCSNDGFIRYKTPAYFFSTLANDANLLSITVGGLNRKLTIDYATTASQLNNTSVSDPNSAASDLYVKWYSRIPQSSGYAGNNYGFPVSNNANGILWLGTHSGTYGWQMGFSSNGHLYARYISNHTFPTTANGGSWNRIAWTTDTLSYITVTNSDSNSTYRMVWHNESSLYSTGGIYCNPYTNYLYASSMQTSNWFRSTGLTGWYNLDYGGGIYMTDATYVRTYNSKAFYVSNTGQHAIHTAGGFASAKTSGSVFSTYYNGTWYGDTLYTHGNGNLSISAPGGSLYISYNRGNTYFGGGTYYINRSGYFNGSCSSADTASKVTVTDSTTKYKILGADGAGSLSIYRLTNTIGANYLPVYIDNGYVSPVLSIRLNLYKFTERTEDTTYISSSITLTESDVRESSLFVTYGTVTVTLPTPSASLVGTVLFFKSGYNGTPTIKCTGSMVYHNRPMSLREDSINLSSSSAIFVCMRYGAVNCWVLFLCT